MIDGGVDLLEHKIMARKIVQLQTVKLELGAPKSEDSISQQVFTECGEGNGRGGVDDL